MANAINATKTTGQLRKPAPDLFRGLPLQLPQNRFVQRQIGRDFGQPIILLPRRLQFLDLIRAHFTALLLPAVAVLFGQADLPDRIQARHPSATNGPPSESTTHRAVALRDALADNPQFVLLAALHAMAPRTLYHYDQEVFVEIDPHTLAFGVQAPGPDETAFALSFDDRIACWANPLPKYVEELWDLLSEMEGAGLDGYLTPYEAPAMNLAMIIGFGGLCLSGLGEKNNEFSVLNRAELLIRHLL